MCLKINKFCVEHHLKQVIVKSIGQIGYLRLYDQFYTSRVWLTTAFQPKEDGEKHDMKIAQPFGKVKTIIDEYDIDNLDDKHKKLVPFIVILSKELDKWKAEVNSVLVSSMRAEVQRPSKNNRLSESTFKLLALL